MTDTTPAPDPNEETEDERNERIRRGDDIGTGKPAPDDDESGNDTETGSSSATPS